MRLSGTAGLNFTGGEKVVIGFKSDCRRFRKLIAGGFFINHVAVSKNDKTKKKISVYIPKCEKKNKQQIM